MANFGHPKFGLSKLKTPLLIHKIDPEGTYTFHKYKILNVTTTYICTECQSLKKSDNRPEMVPRVRVRDNLLLDDPANPRNPHICQPLNSAEVDGQQLLREAVVEIKTGRKRPRDAYNDAQLKVS